MTQRTRIKAILLHFAVGLLVPALLLANDFLLPEPYSHPLIYVSLAPTRLMPFLENRELMRDLTVEVFGRMTPNYAPITIVFLIAFWFLIGLVGSVALTKFWLRKNA